jgi:hypothetical protein
MRLLFWAELKAGLKPGIRLKRVNSLFWRFINAFIFDAANLFCVSDWNCL